MSIIPATNVTQNSDLSADHDPKFGAATLALDNFKSQSPESRVGGALDDPFWQIAEPLGLRWNKVFPYQFIVVRRNGNRYDALNNWQFTLPIPPTDLTISTPMAIVTTPTLGGIIEEHNAAPLRTISLRGTTGVLPLKGSAPQAQTLTIADAIFAGTLAGVGGTVRNIRTAISGPTFSPNLISDASFDTQNIAASEGFGTGYFQFQLLRQFLESYITVKKTKAGKDLRLAFAMWKDISPAVYLVTPVLFDMVRNASSPFEYNYNIQLRAWKRVRLKEGTSFFQHQSIIRRPNDFAAALNRLEAARKAVQAAKNTLRAVRADIDAALFEPLRSVILFAKDTLGVPIVAADLPANIVHDLKEPVLEAVGLKTFPHAISRAFADIGPKIRQQFQTLLQQIQDLSVSSGKAETGTAQQFNAQQELNGAATPNKIFDNPNDNFDFFKELRLGALNLSPGTTKQIASERARVRSLTRKDFEAIRDSFQSVLDDFTDFAGAGHPTYTRTFMRQAVVTTKVPTPDDFDVIFNMNQAILEANRLAASGQVDDRSFLDSINFIAGLATRSGIAFTVPTSKFSVPMPYGHTLEQISALYLGTPDRWHEIAALNGLRAPFVDEVGFDLTLLTNGNGNQVTVSDITNLFVGQGVYISSVSAPRTFRRITGLENLSPGFNVVSVDGDPNLTQYTTLAGAVLHAFLPDTANSQMTIFIPSTETPSQNDFKAKSIPGINEFDDLVRIGGVDLLLTPLGDLVFTPDGDTRLAVGLTNLIQEARLSVATPLGSLIHHPEFGLGISAGTNIADLSAKDLLQAAKNLFANNPKFTGVQSASILLHAPVAQIALTVGIAGTNLNLPLTFEIKR